MAGSSVRVPAEARADDTLGVDADVGEPEHDQVAALLLAGNVRQGGAPTGALADAIAKKWGSVDDFKKAFQTSAVGNFGSGWTSAFGSPWFSDSSCTVISISSSSFNLVLAAGEAEAESRCLSAFAYSGMVSQWGSSDVWGCYPSF